MLSAVRCGHRPLQNSYFIIEICFAFWLPKRTPEAFLSFWHQAKQINTPNGVFICLVEMTGFEPAASCSQSKRATNCATPRGIKLWSKYEGLQNWSKLWSNDTFRKYKVRKIQYLCGFSRIGVLRYT